MQLDDALEVLSNEERRQITYFLEEEAGSTVEYSDIVDHVARERPEEERQRIRVSMRHIHLPRLDESEVIKYDERSETVRYTPGEEFSEILKFVQEYE